MTRPAQPFGPPWSLGARSAQRLKGVDPGLVRVVNRALLISPLDFTVLEGVRTKARQAELLKAGATWTMNSRHLTGDAVDLGALVDGEVRWDWPLYIRLANAMAEAAQLEQVAIRWGGTWTRIDLLGRPLTAADLHRTKPDGPHFERPR